MSSDHATSWRLRVVTIGVVASGTLATPATAQQTVTNRAMAEVGSLGAVLDRSVLELIDREPGGDVRVAGTVTTRHNGPYRLQVRLTHPFTEQKGKRTIINQVLAETPTGPTALDAAAWVTTGDGPGAASIVNGVEYLVVWGMGASKSPASALDLPLEYRVVPLDDL